MSLTFKMILRARESVTDESNEFNKRIPAKERSDLSEKDVERSALRGGGNAVCCHLDQLSSALVGKLRANNEDRPCAVKSHERLIERKSIHA